MKRAQTWALAGFASCLIFHMSIMAGLIATVVTAALGAFQ